MFVFSAKVNLVTSEKKLLFIWSWNVDENIQEPFPVVKKYFSNWISLIFEMSFRFFRHDTDQYALKSLFSDISEFWPQNIAWNLLTVRISESVSMYGLFAFSSRHSKDSRAKKKRNKKKKYKEKYGEKFNRSALANFAKKCAISFRKSNIVERLSNWPLDAYLSITRVR
jgi:hypothetical protein